MSSRVDFVLRQIALTAAILLAVVAPAHGQSPVREGAALIKPPTGWTRVTDASGTRYVSPDKTTSLTVGHAAVYTGSLAGAQVIQAGFGWAPARIGPARWC